MTFNVRCGALRRKVSSGVVTSCYKPSAAGALASNPWKSVGFRTSRPTIFESVEAADEMTLVPVAEDAARIAEADECGAHRQVRALDDASDHHLLARPRSRSSATRMTAGAG